MSAEHVRVTVSATRGSAPREAGAAMIVSATETQGTIGGGMLEWQAIRTARRMLAEGKLRHSETLALGPALGQCCGGVVTLDFAAGEDLPAPAGRPLWIWGAGHVGRALVQVMAPLPGWRITWADIAADRFPEAPDGVTVLPAADLPRLAAHAPRDAAHLIVTLSHDIDLDLCHAILSRGFRSCGLIGSATKWARFRSRLAQLGHSDAQILRIACPIGDPALGKHPQAIAVGVAAALLHQEKAANRGTATDE